MADVPLDTVDAIHVYLTGEEHVASMDCRCEPVSRVYIELFARNPLPIIVHGYGIEVLPALTSNRRLEEGAD